MKFKQAFQVIGLLALALSLSACGSKKKVEPDAAAVRPVKLITLERASSATTNTYPAVIQAAKSRQLSFQVNGQLVELPIKESQEVRAGEVLAKLEQKDYRNQLDATKAQFNSAKAEYERAERLFEQDAISKSILEQRKSQRDVTQAQFSSAEKALKDTVLLAPFDGVIAKVDATKLDTVQAGSAIITLLGKDGMQVTADIPATLVATINQRKDKSAIVILDSAENQLIPAEFKEADLEADSSTQTFALTFTFQPPEELVVLPGMNATLVLSSFSVDESHNGLYVSIAAINADSTGTFVWLVDPATMKVAKQNISVEPGVGKEVRVIAGLKSGDIITGAGGAYLAEGMEVRPWVAE